MIFSCEAAVIGGTNVTNVSISVEAHIGMRSLEIFPAVEAQACLGGRFEIKLALALIA